MQRREKSVITEEGVGYKRQSAECASAARAGQLYKESEKTAFGWCSETTYVARKTTSGFP